MTGKLKQIFNKNNSRSLVFLLISPAMFSVSAAYPENYQPVPASSIPSSGHEYIRIQQLHSVLLAKGLLDSQASTDDEQLLCNQDPVSTLC